MTQNMPIKSQKSYLERIKFDPKLLLGPIASWVTNVRLVVLLVITILFLGVVSYVNIPKRLNPEINIPIITVVTVLPGASPEDIESLVSIPLEAQLGGLSGIDTMASVSQNNASVISLQFLSNVSKDKVRQDVQSAVDSVTNLPVDAQSPQVKALDFEDQPIWTFTVTTAGDIPSLMRFSEQLKKNIESVAKVDRVIMEGLEDQDISIQITPAKIREYGLNPLTISNVLKSTIASYPAGSIKTSNNSFALTVDPIVTTVADIRKLRLNLSGTIVTLGDIATVTERSKLNQQPSYIANNTQPGKRTVTVSVYKKTNSDFDSAEKAVKNVVDLTLIQNGNRFKIDTVINSAEEISTQYGELLGEFRSTILLVMACLFVFLGLRQALISSLTVPLTFLSAFVLMQMLGMSINFLSLFAFLIALGLLVDDTIVTVQAMTSYYNTGKFTPIQTGVIVWRDLIIPIWSTTITTIWSFVPLLLSTGIIGEFIKPIPIVVTVTMLSSTAIAVLITLPFMIVLLKPQIPHRVIILVKILLSLLSIGVALYIVKSNPFMGIIALLYLTIAFVYIVTGKKLKANSESYLKKHPVLTAVKSRLLHYMNHGVISLEWPSRKYYNLISQIISSKGARKKVIWGIVFYAIVAFSLLPLGFVKNEFFPKTDAEVVYVNLEMPPGSNTSTTESESLSILDDLRKTPDSFFTLLNLGTSLSRFGGTSENQNNALFTIHLKPEKQRLVKSYDLAEKIRQKFSSYNKAKISVVEQSAGPPAGADIQITLLGDSLLDLDSYADKLMNYLKTKPGVTNIQKSIKPGTSKVVFVPDLNKISESGLTVDQIGLWLRTFASGFILTSVKFDKDARTQKDVVFTFTNDLESPESLGSINIPTTSGNQIPLISLGNFETRANPTSITRQDNKRTLTVTAATTKGFSSVQISKELEKYADSLKLPQGYNWKTGGINEENNKSIQSILQAMIVAFILILVTMVIQFKSYRQALLVLLVIPLAVSSVFVVFALTGTPLSFPALIGILSLFGIVVTNSMFIVDKININLKEKMPFNVALADAGASRLEPILLTKLCTVFGLLPITLSNPLWRGLGGAIISGILIASTIMLLFIPAVYYEWFHKEQK